jgi:hypothetical protein
MILISHFRTKSRGESTMQTTMKKITGTGVLLGLAVAMTGCAGITNVSSGPVLASYQGLHGTAMGGQQPVTGASIYVYAAGTTGYGSTSTNLLGGTSYPSTITTNSSGSFVTGAFTCNAGQQLYIVAQQGNPGGGNNPQLAMMAALGECSTLTSFNVNINEITTVASVSALAPFMSGITAIGSSATNMAGLARAFASVKKLANYSTGKSTGTSLPAGAVGPVAEVNTLADALASCINTHGGSASSSTVNDSSNCGLLFSAATPSNGTTPADTITAAMNIAQHPANNVTNICAMATVNSPFSPRVVCNTLNDWTMSIVYSPGLASPKTTTIDGSGNIWIANSSSNSVTELAQTGAVVGTYSGNGLNAPAAIAIDSTGNAWVANYGPTGQGTTLSAFTSGGSALTNSPFTPGNLSGPSGLAFDYAGNLWVTSQTNNNLVELNSSATSVLSTTAGIGSPVAVAINPK